MQISIAVAFVANIVNQIVIFVSSLTIEILYDLSSGHVAVIWLVKDAQGPRFHHHHDISVSKLF